MLWPAPGPDGGQRLFCFPGAGAGASTFAPWRGALPGVDVIAFRGRGRESRLLEKPSPDLMATVREAADALEPLVMVPWALFGHSFGALVAFEVVRELRRRAAPSPVGLMVAAARSPRSRIAGGPPAREELIRLLTARAGEWGQPLDADLLEIMLPPLEADTTAAAAYAYRREPPLDFPVVAMAGSEDSEMDAGELRGWEIETTSEFRLQVVPGGHFFIDSNLPRVLEEVMLLMN